jgi:hypothetical protein
MYLARVREGEADSWGLLDVKHDSLSLIAGRMHAWSAQVACGLGETALLKTGRRIAMDGARLLPPVDGPFRIFDAGDGGRYAAPDDVTWAVDAVDPPAGADVRTALIFGVSANFRRTPFNAVLGAVLAIVHPRSGTRGKVALTPWVAAGRSLTALLDGAPHTARARAEGSLKALHRHHALATGDVVILSQRWDAVGAPPASRTGAQPRLSSQVA